MIMSTTFVAFPKIARLNRDIVITEKLDGTNAAVVITTEVETGRLIVQAQSRSRLLSTESKDKDNFGFARWVEDNATALEALGPGHHFGEWYGRGIQRGYGLDERRFALFNVNRWAFDPNQSALFPAIKESVPGLELVPVLYRGPRLIVNEDAASIWVYGLRVRGSFAVPGYMNPEGIVVFHSASRAMYKVTLEGDSQWKGPAAQSPS